MNWKAHVVCDLNIRPTVKCGGFSRSQAVTYTENGGR